MSETFGKIPRSAINAGVVQRMRGADAKVYLAIAAHVGGETWEAYPSLDRLAELTKLTRQGVCKAIRRLEAIPAITTRKGGGRARPNVYALWTGPESPAINSQRALTLSTEPETPNSQQGGTVSEPETVNIRTSKQSTFEPKTVNIRTKNSQPAFTRTDKNRTNRAEQNAADVALEGKREDARAVFHTLAQHGIGEPTASQLAERFPTMTAALVGEALADVNPNAGGGLRVQLIRERMPGLVEREAEAEAKREPLRARLQSILAEYAGTYETHAEAIDTVLGSVSEADAVSLRAQTVAVLLSKLGNTKAASDVIRELHEANGDLLNTPAGKAIAASVRGNQRASIAPRRRPSPQPVDDSATEQKEDTMKLGKAWLAELPDSDVMILFQQLVEDPHTRDGFRQRWSGVNIEAETVRARFGIELIQRYGPQPAEAAA